MTRVLQSSEGFICFVVLSADYECVLCRHVQNKSMLLVKLKTDDVLKNSLR